MFAIVACGDEPAEQSDATANGRRVDEARRSVEGHGRQRGSLSNAEKRHLREAEALSQEGETPNEPLVGDSGTH